MKTLTRSLCMLSVVACLAGCTVTEAVYTPAYGPTYTSAYVEPVGLYAGDPYVSYAGYGYDMGFYGATPAYYDTSLYVTRW